MMETTNLIIEQASALDNELEPIKYKVLLNHPAGPITLHGVRSHTTPGTEPGVIRTAAATGSAWPVVILEDGSIQAFIYEHAEGGVVSTASVRMARIESATATGPTPETNVQYGVKGFITQALLIPSPTIPLFRPIRGVDAIINPAIVDSLCTVGLVDGIYYLLNCQEFYGSDGCE